MSNKSLNIIVTGTASGLGLEIKNALVAAGHAVCEIDKVYGHDVSNPPEWLSEEVADKSVDGLINCAGINRNEWFEDVTKEGFEKVMQTNAWSFVAMTQAVLGTLKESADKGRDPFIINIVSNAAHIPMTSSLAYNASKAAALMITCQMAHELTNKYGITIFSISPNKLSGTGMSKEIEANVCKVRGWTPEFAAEYQRKALMHGLETPPEAIASYIANLIETGGYKFLSGCDVPFGK